MDFTEIVYERRGEVTIIKFNRPEVHNCIGPTTHRELVAAWNAFRCDADAKVACPHKSISHSGVNHLKWK